MYKNNTPPRTPFLSDTQNDPLATPDQINQENTITTYPEPIPAISDIVELTNRCFEPLDDSFNATLDVNTNFLENAHTSSLSLQQPINPFTALVIAAHEDDYFRNAQTDVSFLSEPFELKKHNIDMQASTPHIAPLMPLATQAHPATRHPMLHQTKDYHHKRADRSQLSKSKPTEKTQSTPAPVMMFDKSQTYYFLNGYKVVDFSKVKCDPRINHPYIQQMIDRQQNKTAIQYIYTEEQLKKILPLWYKTNDDWRLVSATQIANIKERVVDSVIERKIIFNAKISHVVYSNEDYICAHINKTQETKRKRTKDHTSDKVEAPVFETEPPKFIEQIDLVTSPSLDEPSKTAEKEASKDEVTPVYVYLDGDPVSSSCNTRPYQTYKIALEGNTYKMVYTPDEQRALLPLRYLDGNQWCELDASLLSDVKEVPYMRQLSRKIHKSRLINKLKHLDFVNEWILIVTNAEYQLKLAASTATVATDESMTTSVVNQTPRFK